MQPDVAAWSHMYLQEITMVRAASLCNYVFVVPKKKKSPGQIDSDRILLRAVEKNR